MSSSAEEDLGRILYSNFSTCLCQLGEYRLGCMSHIQRARYIRYQPRRQLHFREYGTAGYVQGWKDAEDVENGRNVDEERVISEVPSWANPRTEHQS